MASNAGWQTSASGQTPDNTVEEQRSERRFDQPGRPYAHSSMGSPLAEPMDQQTVASLIRRLVDRVEETERRYGQALDELHTRFDSLSHTADTARGTFASDSARSAIASERADTFDRLHEQVSSLARRLDGKPQGHLDDFERLGRVLSENMRGDLRQTAVPAQDEPTRRPYAQPTSYSRRPNHLTPDPAPLADWAWGAKPTATPELNNRLTEMANRLEQSIGAAMPSSTIEALNTRLEEVGNQIAQSLEAAPSPAALAHVERQIADLGEQLNRAQGQLSQLGGVEERLLQLLARLEKKDTGPRPVESDATKLQEIAAKAAVEAARLVADDSQGTSNRLDAMQRELHAVSQTSRQADDKLNSSLQSVHESLKQLIQQIERPNVPSPQANPFSVAPDRKRRVPIEPAPAQPNQVGSKTSTQPKIQTTPAPKPDPVRTPTRKPKARQEPTDPQRPKGRGQLGSTRSRHSSKDDAEARVKETLRERLDATDRHPKPRNLLAAFERARAPHLETATQDLSRDLGRDFGKDLGKDLAEDLGKDPSTGSDDPREVAASEDLVAAARRAAQDAAAQAAALAKGRERNRPRIAPESEALAGDHNLARKRSYLIICAAILLMISAILLFGRLASQTAENGNPILSIGTAPPAEKVPASAAADQSAPKDPASVPANPQSGSFGLFPHPEFVPLPGTVQPYDHVGKVQTGVTDIPKTQAQRSPASTVTLAPQPASLQAEHKDPLTNDVIFSVEGPASANDVALSEKLTTPSAKGPMPPEAIGSKALRQAASSGNPNAQYTVGLSYIRGDRVVADPKTGSEWMERAARSGLAQAQYRLGTMYERGLGVSVDLDTARSWYLAAAERGNVKAMHNLAVSVSSGRSGNSARNYALAAKWFGEAAERNLADSQFNLGILAEHGKGQTKDLAEAYKWYALAAKQDDREAQKRRDKVSAQLPTTTIVRLNAMVATWEPKEISPEANAVIELPAWQNKASSTE